MNRETIYRGKTEDGRWVFGYYVKTPITDENSGCQPEAGWYFLSDGKERHCIVQDGVCFIVLPETVGQFIGLKDKNAKEIYEGDIISLDKILSTYNDCPITIIGIVFYNQGKYEVDTKKVINKKFTNKSSIHFDIKVMDWIHIPEFIKSEVIGNIYDNPELLNEK